jgi:taurine dioxygenase
VNNSHSSAAEIARHDTLSILPWSGSAGARVDGVDLAQTLAPEVIALIRSALLAHGVIFFEGQSLSPQQLVAVAGCFGEPMQYPQLPGLVEAPLVTAVLKREQEREAFGGVWHSDTTYLARPPMATLLYGVEIPPVGGDTLFANQYLAYENLSGGLKKALQGLRAISSSAKAEVSRTREDRLRESGREVAPLEAEHPVVRTHPETGRRALYVNQAHTVRICDWSSDESRGLLEHLFAHQIRPEFTCRWRWSAGALALWDNRCVQHLPVNDYHGHRRLMHRVTLAGDVPV